MVYLLHFDKPLKRAKHYLGYTNKELQERLERHRAGNGSKLMKALVENGIGFQVARVWPDADRSLERKLKNQKNAQRFCPICNKS